MWIRVQKWRQNWITLELVHISRWIFLDIICHPLLLMRKNLFQVTSFQQVRSCQFENFNIIFVTVSSPQCFRERYETFRDCWSCQCLNMPNLSFPFWLISGQVTSMSSHIIRQSERFNRSSDMHRISSINSRTSRIKMSLIFRCSLISTTPKVNQVPEVNTF